MKMGALEDLKRLVMVRENPDIQCHAAGTLRNLAAENQAQVSKRQHLSEELEFT